MTREEVSQLACPICRGVLVLSNETLAGSGGVRCHRCAARWPIRDGIPSFVDDDAVQGVERFILGIYDWLAPLHDPAVDFLLPLLQGSSAAAARERYLRRLELGRLATEVSGRAARILEVGVGSGGNLPFLERQLPPHLNVDLWGLDFSAGMLAQCRRRLALGRGRVMRLLHADAHALPFPDASFDRVFHVGGIASYRDPACALAEMARVARPQTPIVVVDEQLDPATAHGLLRRLAFRAITFYDPAPHAPREHLPPGAVDVIEEQVSRFYYCLTFRASADAL
jgi:ubiquinone/menaquinone biosynthesis C-methylase UbiE/uncharacterized protein YbaR (Trm112 family)